MNDTTQRVAPGSQPRLTDTVWLGNERLFAVALLLAIAPLWFGRYLPLVDMPQHAAQIGALRQIWAGNATFTDVFWVNWFTPYLLGYLLLYVLSLLMPVTIAAKLVVSLAVISVPWLTGRLLRAAGADERWKWLAIPGSYSFAFYCGFLSFIVAAPFALLFLMQTIRFVRTPSLRNAVITAAFSLFLFFCHVIVLGFASLTALGYVVGSHYRDMKGLALRVLPYAAPLPLIALWSFVTYRNEVGAQHGATFFGPLWARLVELLVAPSGHEILSALITVPITGSVVLLPWLAGSRFSRRPQRWLPFALGFTTFLVAPSSLFGAAYFYERLGIFLAPLWFLAWDPPVQRTRRFDWAIMLLVVLWMFMNTGRFAAFARETRAFDDVMTAVEPNRRVASMVYDGMSPAFPKPVYVNFPAWYQATHACIVDFNFADFYSQMVRYKRDAGPRMGERLAWYPTEFQWQANGGGSYDYFIVKSNFDISNEIFKEHRAAVQLVARSGWWWLYRNNARQGVPGSLEKATQPASVAGAATR